MPLTPVPLTQFLTSEEEYDNDSSGDDKEGTVRRTDTDSTLNSGETPPPHRPPRVERAVAEAPRTGSPRTREEPPRSPLDPPRNPLEPPQKPPAPPRRASQPSVPVLPPPPGPQTGELHLKVSTFNPLSNTVIEL